VNRVIRYVNFGRLFAPVSIGRCGQVAARRITSRIACAAPSERYVTTSFEIASGTVGFVKSTWSRVVRNRSLG
jgi:hypothetical protein